MTQRQAVFAYTSFWIAFTVIMFGLVALAGCGPMTVNVSIDFDDVELGVDEPSGMESPPLEQPPETEEPPVDHMAPIYTYFDEVEVQFQGSFTSELATNIIEAELGAEVLDCPDIQVGVWTLVVLVPVTPERGPVEQRALLSKAESFNARAVRITP